jgi:hypothetical protein
MGLDGQVIEQARQSHQMPMEVEYMDHIDPVLSREMLVVPIGAYDSVL